MANRTVKDAHSVKGTNPQYLIEKVIRLRIYECKYWKETCFALSAELLVDAAMDLRYIGGIYSGNVKPSPFLCLLLKMLQIQPEKDIVIEFIKNEDFKYVRCLGSTYMRITGSSLDCYKYLEPLYNDYRKIRRLNQDGTFRLTFVDEFIDELLTEDRILDVILPRIQKRRILEDNNSLEARVSLLDDDLDDVKFEPKEIAKVRHHKLKSPIRSRKSPEKHRRKRSTSRERRKHRDQKPDHRENQRTTQRDHHRPDHPRRSGRDDRRGNREHGRDAGRDGRRRSGGGAEHRDQLSVREANEIRANLGLPPLK